MLTSLLALSAEANSISHPALLASAHAANSCWSIDRALDVLMHLVSHLENIHTSKLDTCT
jgi:hypothetical protein